MFFYLAKKTQNTASQVAAFTQKGIAGLTQAKLSELPFIARALHHQIAYDGYKANIDAFIFATVMKEKVFTTISEARLPSLMDIDLPLPLPSVYFQFKKEPSAASKAKMMEKYEVYDVKEHVRGKTTIYTMKSPPPAIILEKIIPVAKESTVAIEGYIPVQSYVAAITVYRIIDSFLRVNSYPYSRTLEQSAVFGDEEGPQQLRLGVRLKKGETVGSKEPPRKKARAATLPPPEDVEMEATDTYETHDLPVFMEVLTAKPSPLPSSCNWGSPKDVPYLPGIGFPYFPEMLAADIGETRSIVIRYFARNLPMFHETTREGIRRYRQDILNFIYTGEGLIVQHILKGIEYALESQTQLYLVFDGPNYLGFVLLGGQWHFFDGGKWVEPVEAEALRTTVHGWITHNISLNTLVEMLNKLPALNGRKEVIDRGDIDTSMKLAVTIGKSSLAGEGGKAAEKEISEMIKHLTFPTKFKGFGIDTLKWMLEMLTTKKDEPLDDNLNVYLPNEGLANLARREMLVFCAFGPLAPNLYSATGTEYSIGSAAEPDTFLDTDGHNKPKNPTIVIPVGTPQKCVESWAVVSSRQKVRFEPNERSKASRCHVFKGEQRVAVWKLYRETIGSIKTEKPVDSRKMKETAAAIGMGSQAEGIDNHQW